MSAADIFDITPSFVSIVSSVASNVAVHLLLLVLMCYNNSCTMAKTKTKKMTKKDVLRGQRKMRFLLLALISITVALVFFNFVLTIDGGWDDINHVSLLMAPSFAMLAFGVALIDIKKYHAPSNSVIAPLALIGISAVFYLIVSITEAIIISGKV